MRRAWMICASTIVAWSLIGCSSMSLEYRNSGRSGEKQATTRAKHGSSPKHASLKIPPGHLPPPGSCRIWIPGTPPGKQPRPGDCDQLARNVPAGAWLVHRPLDDARYVNVSVYEEKRPGVLIEVRVFEASTGAFVRIQN